MTTCEAMQCCCAHRACGAPRPLWLRYTTTDTVAVSVGLLGCPALAEAQVSRLIEGLVVGQVLASQRVRTWSGAASRTVWDVAARCHQIRVAV